MWTVNNIINIGLTFIGTVFTYCGNRPKYYWNLLNLCSVQDMAQSVQQVGANFILFEGFDVLFSLLGEFTKNATPDMKNQGKS